MGSSMRPCKIQELTNDRFYFPNQVFVHGMPLSNFEHSLFAARNITCIKEASYTLYFQEASQDEQQGFSIQISSSLCRISYHHQRNRLYAIQSLLYYLDQDHRIAVGKVQDYPSVPIRGYLLDIARNKIPTLATLKDLANHLFSLRINHFQLYVEGFALEMKQIPDVVFEEEPFTMAEFLELEAYCQERGIDFVGNVNTFGHMTQWLAHEHYHALSECPDGFVQWGFPFPASTLNPTDPESLILVRKMIQSILPYSSSSYFNVNGDEPFELGRGKSKHTCEKMGRGFVYVEFMNQILKEVSLGGKIPMMWADVVFEDPLCLPQLEPAILVDWGYEKDSPFFEHAKLLSSYQFSFMTAPGTTSWNSFASRFDVYQENIRHAVDAAIQHQAMGSLLTDWGDFGHLQVLSISYLPLTYFALLAYQGNVSTEQVFDVATKEFYQNPAITQSFIDLSKIYQLEKERYSNGTKLFRSIQFVDPESSHPIEQTVHIWQTMLQQSPLSTDEINSLDQEIKRIDQQIRMIQASNEIQEQTLLELQYTLDFITLAKDLNVFANTPVNKISGHSLIERIDFLIISLTTIWLNQNKSSNFQKSTARLTQLKAIIENILRI